MRVLGDDIELDVLIDGEDDSPPLLLLHGIISSARTWDWLVPRVADRFRVLRLDFRGHGESERAPGRYQMAGYVADAVAVCEQVAGGPVTVVGHSLGGATAAALAQTRPDLVAAALLEDAPFMNPESDVVLDESNALSEGFRVLRQSIPAMQSAGMSAEDVVPVLGASPYAGGGTLGDLLLDDGMLTMATSMLRVDASVLDPVVEGSARFVHDPLRPIDVPIVAVAADPAMPDAVTKPADLARLQEVCPELSVHTLAGASHLIHDQADQRERFWAIVEEFLGRSA